MSRSRTHHNKRKTGWDRASRAQRPGKGSRELTFARNWQMGDDER